MQIVPTRRNQIHSAPPRVGRHRGHLRAARVGLKMYCAIAALGVVTLGMPVRSLADPPLVYSVENTGTNCAPPPLPTLGNLPYIGPLPDPFMWADGSGRSTNFVDWECHRAEFKAQIENYEIGPKPAVGPTNVTASYAAGTLTVTVTVGTNKLTLTCAVTLPSGSGPFPVCIGMDSPYGSLPSSFFTSRNIAGITYHESQVTTYNSPQNSDPFYKLYGPAQNIQNTGQYAAWAWGVSRVIDGLYKLNGTLGTAQIDLNHIAVTGCSYAGKLALFSGAFDERIALTIAQESGGGGANSWRYNHTEPSGSVEDIDNTSYQWFSTRMQQFSGNNVSYLPEDHHMLDAMVAPRALYVTGNTDYTWLGNPSCYVCSRAVQKIYSTLGIADRFGFNVDGGHSHCAFPNDQTNDLAYFLDKFMLGNTNLSSVAAGFPASYVGINYTRWTQWWGTGNPIFPDIALSIPNSATEGDGTVAGSVSVNSITTTDLVVTLSSSDTNSLTVPASVVIAAGQSNVLFDLTVIDDSLLNGDRLISIIANSADLNSAKGAYITIHDNDTTSLSVALPASASEAAGTLSKAGTVSSGATLAADFPVSLTSSDPTRLTVPSSVVISKGQSSATFDLTLVNNNVIEGPQNVSVTAHVPNWTDGSGSMSILDDDLAIPFHFAWSPIPSPQLIGEPFQVAITALDTAGNALNFRLPVTLSALTAGGATGTNSLLNSPVSNQSASDGSEYVLGYSFTPGTNLNVTHVRSYFGDQVSIWTLGGQLLASQNVVSIPGTWVETPLPAPVVLLAGNTYVIAAHANGTQYFWGDSLPASFANGTITQSFWDYGNVFPTQSDATQWYLVDLRYAPVGIVPIPVSPGTSGSFSTGTWSGNVALLQAGSSVMLQASAGGGYGISNPFNVLPTPKLAITTLGNSIVLSWPVAAAGFNLYQSSDLSSWTTVPGTPVVVGDHDYVTNSIQAGSIYYRLHQP